MSTLDFLTLLGPTASGKTRLAALLAAQTEAEILSADSRQVYRHMDIGTGKDLADYCVAGRPIAHHLIDIAEPGEHYNLFRFQTDFLAAHAAVRARGARAIVCGGSGLYVESLVRSYHISEVPENAPLRAALSGLSLEALTQRLRDLKAQLGEQLHNHTDLDSPQRAIRAIEIATHALAQPAELRDFPQFRTRVFGLLLPREERRRRISARLEARVREGLLAEVEGLLARGLRPEQLIYYGLEYKYLTLHLTGELTFAAMLSALETAIHQFAKRQMTWFRGMERRGCPIHWIDALAPLEAQAEAILVQLRAEGLDF